MFGMNGNEIWFILAIVILLFGGKKIPELMRGIGKGVREFNTAKNSLSEEFEKGLKDDEAKKLSENKEV
jgi:sec-independent protein translocase protein TatA